MPCASATFRSGVNLLKSLIRLTNEGQKSKKLHFQPRADLRSSGPKDDAGGQEAFAFIQNSFKDDKCPSKFFGKHKIYSVPNF